MTTGLAAAAKRVRLAVPATRRRVTRVGWVVPNSLDLRNLAFSSLESQGVMRVAWNARWLNRNAHGVYNEMYRQSTRYDIVVFVKSMDERFQEEARRIQGYGGKVVFDANVNYYEIWGDYDIPGTRPTPEQQRDAVAMTELADWVVSDSSYIHQVAERFSRSGGWIPDNVDLRVCRGLRRHRAGAPVRLVWCGMAHKASPLVSILDVLASLRGAELVVVSNERPPVADELERALPSQFVPFTLERYAKTLLTCDVIVSPKRLVNGYELGHTEYKITPGMAVGLPAVASPQQSYVEAISHLGGGFVADTAGEWRKALELLIADPALRAELGLLARRTVLERYSTQVVAPQFAEVFARLA
jgi:glycosyltransferase involved in cell wall biosynthesis